MAGEQAEQAELAQTVRVNLLGPFSVTVGARGTGAWPRPSARRLCELVLVSPGRRVSRDLVCEELFPDLDPRTAARSVSKALSMARATLSPLGGGAATLLEADLVHIWASPSAEVDAEAHEAALRDALATGPGQERDDLLVKALAETRQLLADEPYADWAVRPRERLDSLRQEARLTLARDRAKGAGRADPDAVRNAWEACFEHDPANEEAAGALVRIYFATGLRQLAARTYERCSAALLELGLRISPSLDEVYAAASFEEPAKDLVRPEPEVPKSELRTVTVLFAEVAAQVGLARKLGLEAVREMVSGSLAAVITEVEAFGGTVTSVSGGGLQAVFGAPEAHEDDPERALRAAFRATAGTAALRIGVETGPALVGPIGAGGKVEYGVVGDAVGLAAALQSSAAPGSVLVGPVTRAVTDHLFTWGAAEQLVPSSDVGPLAATYLGKPKPRASARRLRLGGRGPLVGRAPELALLDTALRETITGRGSVVLLTGEPGLGKTRLVQECRKRFVALAGGGSGKLPLWLEGRSASYASATPYGLYQQVLASWLGVAPDQPDAVRPALERALQNITGSTELFPPLARMMGLASGAALGRMGPEDLQRATFAALRELLARLVARGPTILALEDLHWADPTSLRLTRELAALASSRRLLVLITSRPGSGNDLSVAAARRIDLSPLPADAERDLARSLVGENAGREVLDTVLANADGNPLFLEERLSSLIETKALVRDQDTWHVRETTELEVPQVLERLVRSRVDRLTPPAREAIRVASVLGAEFPRTLLTTVLRDANPDVIEELLAKDLLHEVAGAPEPTFRFRHALIQEATYEGLLRTERRQLHGRAAWRLEALSGDRVEEHAAVLGRHFAAAGETERALRYLELAGDHATDAFANDEAISSYRAALAITDEQQASSDTAANTAVGIRAKLANVLWRTGRRAEAREAFEDALRLADLADLAGLANDTDTLRKAHLLTRLGRLEMAEHRYEAAEKALDAAAALLPADPAGQDDATVDEWLEMMVDGRADLYAVRDEPERALATLEAARPVLDASGSPIRQHSFYHVLALGRVIQHRYRVDEEDLANIRKALAAAEQGGEEKDVGYATFFVGWVLWLHGDLAAAREHFEASLSMGERIGETILHLESLIQLAMVALHRHDVESVRAHAASAMAVAEARGEDRHLPRIRGCLAWLAWQDRRAGDVIELAGLVAESWEITDHGFFFFRWVYLWPLVALHLEAGNTAAAVAAARQILDPSQQRLPDSLMSLTEQACQAWDDGDPPEAAGDKLSAALALARELGYF